MLWWKWRCWSARGEVGRKVFELHVLSLFCFVRFPSIVSVPVRYRTEGTPEREKDRREEVVAVES